MSRFSRFLVVTLVQGILFLVPIILIAFLAREGYQMLRRVFEPVAEVLPENRLIGVITEDMLTILALLSVFLIAGLFVGTRLGRTLSNHLERTVLYRVPGYFLVRGAVGEFPGLSLELPTQPVLVETGEGWAFALLVEREPGGYCTVFLPESPTPTSGSVRIIEANRVRTLDVPMLRLLNCLTRSGAGAGSIAGKLLTEQPADGSDSRDNLNLRAGR